MKIYKLTLPLTLIAVVALALGAIIPCVYVPQQAITASAAETTAYQGTYYSGITATSGTALLGQLHDLIVKRTKYSSYSECKTKAPDTDPGSGNNTVMEFYTQIDIDYDKWDVSGGWNREHVWPKSNSNGLWKSETVGGGSDLHHIRPAEKDLNNDRGNLLYGKVSNGTARYTSVSDVLGGYSSGGVFEPLDKVKGDVARICMYVYTHYNTYSNVYGTTNGSGDSKYFGTLKFRNNVSASNEDAAIKLLLEWNKLDPVDDIERNRNEAVYKIQGNRNPFIDNENYADAIWGTGTVDPPVQPTLTALTLSPNTVSLNVGATQTLTVSATPSNANASVTWSSSNTSVATVNNNGVVTAVAAGSATITATSTTNSSIKATAQVTVNQSTVNPPTLTALTLTPNTVSLSVGATQTLTVSATPSNANASVTWSSSNTSVATVNNGVVTAVAAGSATITATSTTNSSIKATVQVTVTQQTTNPPVDPVNPNPPTPPATTTDPQKFISAVEAVSRAQGMEEQFYAIKAAIIEYGKLSAADKETSDVKTHYQLLTVAVADYNTQADAVNAAMDSATKSGAYMLSAATLAAVALIAVLKRKFN